MNITLLKYPTDEDWALAKQCALVTIGKEMKTAPDMEWKHAILRARHSPIRTLQFAFYLEGVPYWVSTHLARHVHAQPFIRSQRNDRAGRIRSERSAAGRAGRHDLVHECRRADDHCRKAALQAGGKGDARGCENDVLPCNRQIAGVQGAVCSTLREIR